VRELALLGLALLLLLLTLSVAMSYLAGPMAVTRKTGAFRAGRWAARTGWRCLSGTVRAVSRSRRPRIRRPAGLRSMGRRS